MAGSLYEQAHHGTYRGFELGWEASHKFWRLYELMKKDKKKPGVCLEMRMQDMVLDLARLINDGVISYADLEGFSEETIEVAKRLATQT